METNTLVGDVAIPSKVLTDIKAAYIAGLVSAAITLGLVVYSFFAPPFAGVDRSALVDVGIILALSFGIYRKSRSCALLMLIYFIGAKAYMVWQGIGLGTSGLITAVVFGWFFFKGARGTFQYHKLAGTFRNLTHEERRKKVWRYVGVGGASAFALLVVVVTVALYQIFGARSGRKSYDNDTAQQCLVLTDAYPGPFSVDELEKLRVYTNAKDPEMVRAYLLGLAKAKEAECRKEEGALDQFDPKITQTRQFEWQQLVTFYEEWVKPSPEGRVKFAIVGQKPYRGLSGEPVEMDYTLSAVGQGFTTLVLRAKKPGLFDSETRDGVVESIKSNRKFYFVEGAVGFTAWRFENPDGKGITVKLTPHGRVLPLLSDDFR